jgi:decaprenylphospho-beta-D-ribofuranose 2-oxidase
MGAIPYTTATRFLAHVTEVTVCIVFAIGCLNALGQGRRWLFTAVWGAVAGFAAEVFLVHLPEPRYSYGLELFWLHAWNVPICVGLGWGIIFYIATWTAQRLRIDNLAVSSFVAGGLGVNIDLSLDPVAHLHGFWIWRPLPDAYASATLCHVPFDNFVAWVVIIAVYGGCVRGLFRLVNKKAFGAVKGPPGGAALAKTSLLIDFIVPPVGAGLAAVIFVLVRSYAVRLYGLVSLLGGYLGSQPVGEALVFGVLFIGTLGTFWWKVLRCPRDEAPNKVVLGTVVFFHLLCLVLLFAGNVAEATPMLVLIPLGLVAGFLAYAWPSLNELCKVPSSAENHLKMPYLTWKTLASYGGRKVRVQVARPADEEELRNLLGYACKNRKRITLRAGGQAFDTQSLNDQIVIQLDRFRSSKLEVDLPKSTITVRCGDTWADVLRATLPVGRAPAIMVTSSAATVGGTLSSHSLSRFSPTCGREGKHVVSFKLLTVDGQLLTCSRQVNGDLFRGVIGGLGYLGAILEITYRLRDVPVNAVVKTVFTRVEGFPQIGRQVRAGTPPRFGKMVGELVEQRRAHCRRGADVPEPAPVALSAAVNMRGGVWGLVARSEYVPPQPLMRSVFHSPRSVLHMLLQLAATIPLLRAVGYWLTYRVAYTGEPKTFVDEPFGYTFFEDGNRLLRRWLHALGIPARIRQQTFFLPVGGGPDEGGPLEAFLTRAGEYLDGRRQTPALIDVLYVARDEDTFVLSSSNGLDGYAVTLTFESLFASVAEEEKSLAQLSGLCRELGGRVHLAKNVCAAPDLIAAMYDTALGTMKVLRESRGAEGALENEFADRVLPGLSARPGKITSPDEAGADGAVAQLEL